MTTDVECHGLDTPDQIFFYEQDYYVFSNFSSFQVIFDGIIFPTSEHVYHWMKFGHYNLVKDDVELRKRLANVRGEIRRSMSAHEAFEIGQANKDIRHPDWDDIKVGIMEQILHAKVKQNPYVLKKLLASGDRELIENSWRDDQWGWGPNKDGQNLLGKCWMKVRSEVRASLAAVS